MSKLKYFRKYHRIVAPILFLPLLVTVITGVGFDLAEELFHAPDNVKETIISIHKGGYLGEKLSILYVILNGLGVVVMLITGLLMLMNFRSRQHPSD